MALPTITARATPVGIQLKDGFRTVIAFSQDPDISFWEVSGKLAGVDAGEPISQDNMWNTRWRVKRMKALIDGTPSTFKVNWDPLVRSQVVTIAGMEGAITEWQPDGSAYAYFGALKSFEPDEVSEGMASAPTASVTVVPTNWDPTNHVEQGPIIVAVAGT